MNISEFERKKPKITREKIKELEKLIVSERQKTEALYTNRIAMLDKALEKVKDVLLSFEKGE
jgi:hypothetical protein